MRISCPVAKILRGSQTYSTTSASPATQPQPQPQALPHNLQHRTNPHHHDLPSFLAHAARTSLDPTTTVYSGTHYEYTVQQSLARLGLTLTRTGGASDKGIDLIGTWALPSLPVEFPLRVLVQCKALKRKAVPAVVRELEGAFAGAPVGWRGVVGGTAEGVLGRTEVDAVDDETSDKESEDDEQNLNQETHGQIGRGSGVIGLLVAPKEATKGVRDAMSRSRWPMGYVKIDLGGRVEQLLWNKSAAQRGLEGVGVVTRHVPKRVILDEEEGSSETTVENEVVLTWKREPWEWK